MHLRWRSTKEDAQFQITRKSTLSQAGANRGTREKTSKKQKQIKLEKRGDIGNEREKRERREGKRGQRGGHRQIRCVTLA